MHLSTHTHIYSNYRGVSFIFSYVDIKVKVKDNFLMLYQRHQRQRLVTEAHT